MTEDSWQKARSDDFWDITAKVGQLKRAAIDAYMVGPRSRSWVVETWRIDSEYSYQVDSPVGDVKLPIVGSAHRCSRPDRMGNGGGVVKGDGKVLPAQSEVEAFDRIRKRIDEAVERWCYLPAYQHIAEIVQDFGTVRNSLVVTDALDSDKNLGEDGRAISGVGEIKGIFDLIQGIVTDKDFMAGETAREFKSGFLAQIRSTVINLGMVARDLVLAMAVQYGRWKGVREDVASLVDAAIAKCRAIKSKPAWQEQLRVLQTVYDVASIFFPPGRMASGVASVAFTVAGGLVDTSEGSVSLGSYDAVLRGLESSLEKLDETVENLEKDIRDHLVTPLLTAMSDNIYLSYAFDPSAVAWTSDEIVDPDLIQWPDGRVVTDLADYLWKVADALDGGGKEVNISGLCKDRDVDIVSSVVRSSQIGLGQCGPGEDVRELNGALYRALDDLAWKMRGGADNLLAAYEWHVNTDEAGKTSLNAIAQEIENGSGITIVKEDDVTADVPPVCVAPQPGNTGGAPREGVRDSGALGIPDGFVASWRSLVLSPSAEEYQGRP